MYDCLRLLYLRLFNEEERTIEMMESQFTHRIEMMLSEERVCLERHKEELSVCQVTLAVLRKTSQLLNASAPPGVGLKECSHWGPVLR